MTASKFIGNVNVLDLRRASEETIAGIAGIGNANIVLYTPETAALLGKLHFGNLNASVEVPADVKVDVIISQLVIQTQYFENLAAPVFPVVVGQVIVEPDVTAASLEKGLSGLVTIGQVVCPEGLSGVIQAKTQFMVGQTKAYPVLKQFRKSSIEMDQNFLQSLDDGTEMTVIGSITARQVLPDALLQQKVRRLFVLGEIQCHEENSAFFNAHLVEGSGNVSAIPAGFEWVRKPLVLDEALLESLKTPRLYCKERVRIEPEVTAALLDERLEAVASEDMIVCPLALKAVLAKKCDLLKNRVVFYEGLLWLVDDEQTLRPAYLDALEGKLTLLVTGELSVDAGIDAKVLAGRLAKVHNLGEIRCTPEQMGAIQVRLGIQEGELVDSTQKESPAEPNPNQMDNANYLVL